MRTRPNPTKILVCLSLVYFFLLGQVSFSQEHPTKLSQRQRKQLIENSIASEDKHLLDKLELAFKSLAEFNNQTLNILDSTQVENKTRYNRAIVRSEKAAKQATTILTRRKDYAENLESFIEVSLEDNSLLQSNLSDIFRRYKKLAQVKKYLNQDSRDFTFPAGSYRYYNISLAAFEEEAGVTLKEILSYASRRYRYLAGLAAEHNIKKLKKEFGSADKDIYADAALLTQTKIIYKLELMGTAWADKLIVEGLVLVKTQLDLNSDFLKITGQRLEEVPTPIEPQPADLKVATIDFILPKKVQPGRYVTVVAKIKNDAELPVAASRVKITFPDGSAKTKNVPLLKSKQTHQVKWRYRLAQLEDNLFKVTANHDKRAWESNGKNNQTQRKLIIPLSGE